MNPRLPIVLSKTTVARQLPVIAAMSTVDLEVFSRFEFSLLLSL